MRCNLVMAKLWSPYFEVWRLSQGATYKQATPISIKVSNILEFFRVRHLFESQRLLKEMSYAQVV